MKVVYELITENDDRFPTKITKEELDVITKICEEIMQQALIELFCDSKNKITVKFKSISDYQI